LGSRPLSADIVAKVTEQMLWNLGPVSVLDRHGFYTGEAIAERRPVRALMRKLMG
jgi:hypothetical protein